MLRNFNCRSIGLICGWRVAGGGWRVNFSTSIVVLFTYYGVNFALTFNKPLFLFTLGQILLWKVVADITWASFVWHHKTQFLKRGKVLPYSIWKTVVRTLLVHMAVFLLCLLRWYLCFMVEKYLNYEKLTFEDNCSSLVSCSYFNEKILTINAPLLITWFWIQTYPL